MAAIEMGEAAINRAGTFGLGFTLLSKAGADGTGTIDTIEIWVAGTSSATTKIGIFYEDGGAGKYTLRDSVVIGAVTAGAKRTITEDTSSNPIALDVVTGDLIGITDGGTGSIEAATSGGSGIWYSNGDWFSTAEHAYSSTAAYAISIRGTGATAGATSIKAINGIAIGSIKSINGILIAEIKQFNGVSNVS